MAWLKPTKIMVQKFHGNLVSQMFVSQFLELGDTIKKTIQPKHSSFVSHTYLLLWYFLTMILLLLVRAFQL